MDATAELERTENMLQASRQMLLAARYRKTAEQNRCRPCMLLDVELHVSQVEPGYVASFGPVYAHGHTADLAYQNFDRAWIGRDYDGSQL